MSPQTIKNFFCDSPKQDRKNEHSTLTMSSPTLTSNLLDLDSKRKEKLFFQEQRLQKANRQKIIMDLISEKPEMEDTSAKCPHCSQYTVRHKSRAVRLGRDEAEKTFYRCENVKCGKKWTS